MTSAPQCNTGAEAASGFHERFVAIDRACGWPLLMRLGDGEIGALLWPHPTHGYAEGAVELWASADGGCNWRRVGTPVPHAPTQNRMNHAGGVNQAGEVVALVGGWDQRPPAAGRTAAELAEAAPPYAQCRTLEPVPARSADGGRTWRQFAAVPAGEAARGQGYVPYGRIGWLNERELGVMLYRDDLSFFVSADGGATWSRRGELSRGEAENETAWVRLTNGELFAAARTREGHVVAYRSGDDGCTWRAEGALTLRGHHPADLLVLPDGRVLLSYGVRTPGHWAVHVRWGDAEARDWSSPTMLVDLEDACDRRQEGDVGRDGGYPSTVRLEDGTFVTAYYSRGMPSHRRYHVGVVRWKPPLPEAR